MFLQVSWICVLLLVASCWADQQQQQLDTSSPVEPSFINDLAKKPVKLDPKLRKALLKVLTRLEEEDKLVTDTRQSAIESQPQLEQQAQKQLQQFQQEQQQLQFQQQQQQQFQQQQQQFQRQEQQKQQFQRQEQLKQQLQRQEQQQEQQQQNFERQEQIKQQAEQQKVGPILSAVLPTPQAAAFSPAADSVPPTLSALLPTPSEPAATNNHPVELPAAANQTQTPVVTVSPSTTADTGTVVDFFEAPLLTAFTVQQDSAGVPRRVIPIYADEPDQLERQKILALETKAEAEGGDRNTLEQDRRELEFLKNAELQTQFRPQLQPITLDGLQRESFALQREQQRFQLQQQQLQLIQKQQQQQQQLQQNQLRPFLQPVAPIAQQQQVVMLQQQPRSVVQSRELQQRQNVQQARPIQPQQQPFQPQQQLFQPQQQPFQQLQLPAQRFVIGSFLQPEQQFAQQQQQQQLRVLRQPQQQTFGYGLPRLPGDLDVVYKVLALNHEGRTAQLVPRPQRLGLF